MRLRETPFKKHSRGGGVGVGGVNHLPLFVPFVLSSIEVVPRLFVRLHYVQQVFALVLSLFLWLLLLLLFPFLASLEGISLPGRWKEGLT